MSPSYTEQTGTKHENIANIFAYAIHSHRDFFFVGFLRFLTEDQKLVTLLVARNTSLKAPCRLSLNRLWFSCVKEKRKVLDVIVIDRKLSWDTGTTLSNLPPSLVYFHLQPQKHPLSLYMQFDGMLISGPDAPQTGVESS
jgi:hypothetical protein